MSAGQPMERYLTMQTIDFLLERVVHQVLNGGEANAQRAKSLLKDALAAGDDPRRLIAEILWPALECVQRLHADHSLSARLHNAALRSLRSLADLAAASLTRENPHNHSLLIATAPAESVELGAHLLALLADAAGWQTFFAGAGLSMEELTFSIGRLGPDTLLLHAALPQSAPALRKWIAQLRRAGIAPNLQLAVAGAVVEKPAADQLPLGADLQARSPVEILELLALWPDYRALPDTAHPCDSPNALEFLDGSQISLSTHSIHALLRRHFNPGLPHPN